MGQTGQRMLQETDDGTEGRMEWECAHPAPLLPGSTQKPWAFLCLLHALKHPTTLGPAQCRPPPGLSSPPPASSFWHTHLLAAGVHGHLLPCRPALLTLLPLGGYNIADQDHITGAPGFQGDGVHPEVLEHIENGLEPQVLHPAVTLLIQRQAQVLGGEGEGGFKVGAPVDCSVSPARWDPEVEPVSPWPCPGS